jgi:hypothetical protein
VVQGRCEDIAMRMTVIFLASLGFGLPGAQASGTPSEDGVKRMVEHQLCVRECDTGQLRELSTGSIERTARQRNTGCKMRCGDTLTGRKPQPVHPASTKNP